MCESKEGFSSAQHEESWHNSPRLKHKVFAQRVCAGRALARGLCCPWSISDSWRSQPVQFKHCCLPGHLLYLAEVGKVLHSRDNVTSLIRGADWKEHERCTAWTNGRGKADSFIHSFMKEFEVWEFGMVLFCNGFRLDVMMTMCCSSVNKIQSSSYTLNPWR